MNAIRKYFVSAKHWQLFFVFFGPFAVAALIPLRVWSNQSLAYRLPMTAVSIIVVVYMFLWIWSYGSFLGSVTPSAIRPRLRFLRIALIFFFLYMPVSSTVPVSRWEWLLPLDFLQMFCALYAAFFLAKSLVRAETGKPVSVSAYLVPFVLLWLWPIGIWFIQPRINRLFATNCANGGDSVPGVCETV